MELTAAKRITIAVAVAVVVSAVRVLIQSRIDSYYEAYLDSLQRQKQKRSLLHSKYVKNEDEEVDVIVIGSGMSGLSCAAILARLGRRVLVLEQHPDVCGGGSHMFDLNGYTFDSGLHYTVPWSVPLFALTCYKKPCDVVPFDMMGEDDGTIDKIYLVPPSQYVNQNDSLDSTTNTVVTNVPPFKMKLNEVHLDDLYTMFPNERKAIQNYISISNNAMTYVKLLIFSRLLPKWVQTIYWSWIPSKYTTPTTMTAKELLPTLTSNKRLISLLSSMWIDTGARPDRASFVLTASVFRGISMEGGCYPRGGSQRMAEELVSVIEHFGGKVRIRATVDQILYDESVHTVMGVQMMDGSQIRCTRGVVSSCGALNTFKYLLPTEIAPALPSTLGVQQSAGFVMCNIGIAASPSAIGATNTNTWHIPVDSEGDAFPPLAKYFEDPLGDDSELPAFITFPSLKVCSFYY
jgi:all-trans-retinol 13,14-reductase